MPRHPEGALTAAVSRPDKGGRPDSAALRRLMASAAEAAFEELGPMPDTAAAELRLRLRDLAARLSADSVDAGSLSASGLSRDQLTGFRARILQRAVNETAPIDGRELARVLSVLEELASRQAPPVVNEFTERLSSPDALRAVVEMAHDMRSPLGSILFLVDTIRRGQSGAVTQVQERQLGLVYGAALGLSTLASDVVDAINGDRLVDGQRTPFSITEVLLGVCAIVRPLAEEKNLVLNTTFPQIDGRRGYPSALSRVLLNLSTNALRYTERGSVSVGCTEHSPTLVEFWIEDTGRGIPDNVLAMLFDGFRPGSVGIRFSSAGLGLAICRTLLEKMGSALLVDTAVEEGTRFSFRIELPAA